MRDIKFKAVIPERNAKIIFTLEDLIMTHLDKSLFSIREILIPWLLAGNVPDRYTGLNDKNGVEIYEGDIIIHSEFPARYYTAKFDMIFGLRFIDSGAYYVMPISPVDRPQPSIVVVSNIHENPGLVGSQI